MKVELLDGDHADVNFANVSKVSIKGKRSYHVRWFRRRKISDEYEEIGRMDLESGRWGAYDFADIEQWKVEFWHDGERVCIFDNDLANKPVILVAKTKVGKSIDFDKVKKYCTDKVNEFNCDLRLYIKGSCALDFSNLNFKPLRLNDGIADMYYGLDKEF